MADIDDRSPVVGPLGRLGRFAYRRRGRVLLLWLAGLLAAVALSAAFAGEFTADYSAPGSDSKKAQQVLEQRFPSQSNAVVTVVVRADAGVRDEGVRREVTELLDELTAVPHVAGANDPYATPGAVSDDGQTLLANLRLDVVNATDMPVGDSTRLIDVAEESSTAGMRVALGGQAILLAEGGSVGSEAIGLAVAALILLLTFGSVVAAGLPLLVAVAGLVVSGALTGVVIRFVDAPEWSTSLAAMLGIGIGIDYVLLMVTRFREWRAAGLDPEAATVAALDTAGRSVVVAGITVVVSLLGLFAMGLSYMRGAALGGDRRGPGRAGRERDAVPGAAGLSGSSRGPVAAARSSPYGSGERRRARQAQPGLAAVEWARPATPVCGGCGRPGRDARAGRAVPERSVRFPGRGQQPGRDDDPAVVRPHLRRVRDRRQRARPPGRPTPGRRRLGSDPVE
ncbi:MMPL family transporter [Streptomyces sp. GLT-R25]